MVGLKSRLSGEKPEAPRKGFEFARPEYRAFHDEATFRTAVREQADALALLDAGHLSKIDVNGRLVDFGEEWRLTKEAFGQLCHHAKLPVTYVTRLAERDEALALQVVEEAISGAFRKDPRQLVVNTGTRLVEGVFDEFEFDPLSNARLLDFVLSQEGEQELTRAWIEGPNARMTVIDRLHVLEPKVGDVVHIGLDAQTRLGHRHAALFDLYNERLSCANGMLVRNKSISARVPAGADIEIAAQAAIVRVSMDTHTLGPMMRESARLHFDEVGLGRMIGRLLDPRRGGSHDLLKRAVATADRERLRDGRDEGDFTLWDFVNGVTEAAKTARTMSRETELEGLGYNVMGEFLSPN